MQVSRFSEKLFAKTDKIMFVIVVKQKKSATFAPLEGRRRQHPSSAVTSMSQSPRAPRPLLTCPQCSKQFGKQTKLDSHLLEHHDATLRLSPGVLSPPLSPSQPHEAVRSVLTAALEEANRVFQLSGPPVCSICPNSRAFRNKRDLAQHYVSKHSQCLGMDGDVIVSVMPAVTKSETSVNPRKRVIENVGGSMKRVKLEKQEIKLSPTKTITKPTGSKPPVTPKRSQKTKAVEAPKASAMRKAAASKGAETKPAVEVNPTPQPIVSLIPIVRTAPLDFSCMGGFATNVRKRYYRLSNR